MDDFILITWLNDFIFCPVSIYFHQLYGSRERYLFQGSDQLAGTAAHKSIDKQEYSTKKAILQGIDIICLQYRLVGKIDVFDIEKGTLTERKKHISTIYDGYIFQLYGQYFCLKEMGYDVKQIRFHSVDDNKNYNISLPEEDPVMLEKFENTIKAIRNFAIEDFEQNNYKKCQRCIYEPACDRTLL